MLLRLLEGADVLIENDKPGSMERWGLGYEDTLKEKFPTLIHCRISGFGADAQRTFESQPLRHLPHQDE